MGSPFGLCAGCAHQRLIANTRGSRFSRCERSFDDPRYAKYPRTPVLECGGYEPREPREPREPPEPRVEGTK